MTGPVTVGKLLLAGLLSIGTALRAVPPSIITVGNKLLVSDQAVLIASRNRRKGKYCERNWLSVRKQDRTEDVKSLNVLLLWAPWSCDEGPIRPPNHLVSSGTAGRHGGSQVLTMKRVHVVTISALLVLALVSVSTARQQRGSVSQRSYNDARRILGKGIQALGGIEKFTLVEDISVKYDTNKYFANFAARAQQSFKVFADGKP